MDTQKLQSLIDWLMDGARSAPSPPAFLKETCERLIDCGIPLWRAAAFVTTLASRHLRPRLHLAAGRRCRCSSRRFRHPGHAGVQEQPRGDRAEDRARAALPHGRSREPSLSLLRRHAQGRRHGLSGAAAALHRRHRPCRELDHQGAGRLHRRATRGVAQGRCCRSRASAKSWRCAAPPPRCSTPMSATAPASGSGRGKSAGDMARRCRPRSGCRICAASPRCPTVCRRRPWSRSSTSISIVRCR